MTFINCIILDDESRNAVFLKNLLNQYCPQVNVLAAETDARKGMALISELSPQLVFLDVEMPHLNGFEILKKLEPANFEVIFVTAFSHYAIDAFEHQAIGYLTKPINTEKMQAAVNTAIKKIEQLSFSKNIFSALGNVNKTAASEKIALSTSGGLLFVKLSDIIYCESHGNYTDFNLKDNKKVLVSRQLGEYEKLLPEVDFIRIHDKYIINLSFLNEYIKGSRGEVKMEGGKILPVASRRKDELLSRFEKWIKRKC